jgi:DNA-binding MarR family transcriptional regulator
LSRRTAPPELRTAPSERTDKEAASARVPPNHRVPSFLAFRFHQLCLGIMAEVLGPEGLRWAEYGALTTLDAEPGLDQQSLAARIGIDKVSAGQLIDRLERDGLVSRLPHPTDRRARALHLTAAGLALRLGLQPKALAAQDRILAPLGVEERGPLIELLTRVVEGHGAYARPGNGRLPPRRRAPAKNAG